MNPTLAKPIVDGNDNGYEKFPCGCPQKHGTWTVNAKGFFRFLGIPAGLLLEQCNNCKRILKVGPVDERREDESRIIIPGR